MDVSHLVEGLNENQREVVCADEHNYLVLAGAGSGKTRVIVHRIAWLIDVLGVSPHSILAITFTNKAANEMQTRISQLLKHKSSGIWCGTFHAISLRILKQQYRDAGLTRDFTIMDTADQKRFVRRILETLNMDLKKFVPAEIQRFINAQKEQGIRAKDVERTNDYIQTEFLKVYSLYEKVAFEENLVDFTELLLRTYEMLSRNERVATYYAKKFRHILADEFQDTNLLQLALIKALQKDQAARGQDMGGVDGSEGASDDTSDNTGSIPDYKEVVRILGEDAKKEAGVNGGKGDGTGSNESGEKQRSKNFIMAVGDEDQSIYGWRGAEIANILNFDKIFPGSLIYRLEKNYRSTQTILDAAGAVIANNRNRLGKKIWSDIKDESLIDLFCAPTDKLESIFIADSIAEQHAQGKNLKDFAIFYRANSQSRIIEETLVQNNIPYKVYGGLRFYDRVEIKNVLAYMRLIINRSDNEALRRIINIPSRDIGPTTIGRITDYAEANGLGLWDSIVLLVNDRAKADAASLKSRPIGSLANFIKLIEKIEESIEGKRLDKQVASIIKLSGIEGIYANPKDAQAESARENLQEFVNAANLDYRVDVEQGDGTDGEDGAGSGGGGAGGRASGMESMAQFLDYIALESSSAQAEDYQDAVQLMTIHSAKGLEFPTVFMTGMEEGVFPLDRSTYDENELEEERRICYVGMTRACRKLYLTCCERRLLYGSESYNPISRFVEEIPAELVNQLNHSRPQRVQPPEMIKLKSGQKVMHPTFGFGEVRQSEGTGPGARVEVDFENEGPKWLVLEYADIELL